MLSELRTKPTEYVAKAREIMERAGFDEATIRRLIEKLKRERGLL